MITIDTLPDPELARFNEIGFPVALIHCSSPSDLSIPCITTENKRGAHMTADHLIEAPGYRRIAFPARQEEQMEGSERYESSSHRRGF